MNEIELRDLMYTAQLEKNKGPFSIRYPRGSGLFSKWREPFCEIQIGKSRIIKEGKDLAILSFGHPGNFVVEANKQLEKDGISAAHFDMRFAQPLDEEVLHTIFKNFDKLITVEDGMLKGGFGSAIIEFMSDNGYNAHIKRLGIPDFFIEQGTQEELIAECGFDSDGIIKAVRDILI
jgi:1-deoxy-D-xylulose-5-phosphate synthase